MINSKWKAFCLMGPIEGAPQYQALPDPSRKHSVNVATTFRTNAIAVTPHMLSTLRRPENQRPARNAIRVWQAS